jgi:hypothetical protein
MPTPTDDEWKNLEHSVERHDEAVNQDAADIAQIKRAIESIIEALENLDVYLFQGLNNTTRGEAARDRYREIVKELKAIHTSKK